MEITITCRSRNRANLLNALAMIYCKELKLARSRATINITPLAGLRKSLGASGMCYRGDDGTIEIVLDGRLDGIALCTTLAHEMVHAKQLAFGQMKVVDGKYYWLGKKCKADVYTSPWELEAFGKERILANKVVVEWTKNGGRIGKA